MGGGGTSPPDHQWTHSAERGSPGLKREPSALSEPLCFGILSTEQTYQFHTQCICQLGKDEKFYRFFLKKNVHYRIMFKDKNDYKVMKYFKQTIE